MRGCKDLQQRLLNTPIDHRRNSELAKSSRRLRNFHATHRRRSIRPQEQQLANPRGGTWAGEELSSDPEFFVPLHVAHLEVWCPEVIPFLGLPPGWRFLIADGYEDVWQDASLLEER